MNVVKSGKVDILNGGYYKIDGDERDCEEFTVSPEEFCSYLSEKKLKKTDSDVSPDYDYYIRIVKLIGASDHIMAYIYPEIDRIYMENHGRSEYYEAELSDFGEFAKKFDYSVDPYNAVMNNFLKSKEKGLPLQGTCDTYSGGNVIASEKISVPADVMCDFFGKKDKRVASGATNDVTVRFTLSYDGGIISIYPEKNVIYILTKEPGPRYYGMDLSDFSKVEEHFVRG